MSYNPYEEVEIEERLTEEYDEWLDVLPPLEESGFEDNLLHIEETTPDFENLSEEDIRW